MLQKLHSIATLSFALIFSVFSTISVADSNLPIIAITKIKAPVNDTYRNYRVNAKEGNFQTMLETQMTQVGRFKIIERNRVDEILGEQGLNNEFGDGSTAGGGFNVAGVDYLVYGAITKLGQRKSAIGTGNFLSAALITEFSVDVKVVDASTGEVRKAETVAVEAKTADGMATGSFATVKGEGDPLSDVQRIAAKKVAALIATSIFPIEVVKGGDVVYLNYGSAILDKGDIVSAYRPGEELIDEATGISLGSEESFEGELEVTETTAQFSKAKLLSGETPSKGSLIRIKQKSSEKSSSNGKPGEKRGRKI